MSKILEICLSKDLGGLELYVKNITQNLNTYAFISKKSKLKEIFSRGDLKYFESENFKIFTLFRLLKIIKKNNIEILHFHHRRDMLLAVLVKAFFNKKLKLVYTRHMHMTRFKGDFYHRFLYKNINLIIAVSYLTEKQLIKFIPDEIRPNIITSYIGVKNPANISKDYKIKLKNRFGLKDEFVIGIFGRIEEAKGQHIVLRACEILRQNGYNTKVLVVGGCMDKNYLNSLKSKFINDIFVDFVDEPTDIMQICNVVVLASKNETFGLVLVEAMRCEVAVLGSNKGGPTEIIDDKKTGLLFKSFDSEDLANKLEILIKDESLRLNLAKNAKIKADEKFDEKRHFEEIKEILDGI